MYKKISYLILLIMITVLCSSCGSVATQEVSPEETEFPALTPAPDVGSQPEPETAGEKEEAVMEKELHLYINESEVAVNWEDNGSVEALRELVSAGPLTVQMSMYGGFEQVGSLGADLPRNDKQTTTQAGDIVLYSGDQIVVFYGSNSWAYTRLGRVADHSAAEMAKLLGSGGVTITLSFE